MNYGMRARHHGKHGNNEAGKMKKISAVIPTYNEKESIYDGYLRVKDVLEKLSDRYDYEILCIDNCSKDGTRDILRLISGKDDKVKVILNAVNVGWARSSFYGMINATGDAVVLLAADMQEPPEMIPKFVEEWEKGPTAVIGIKSRSEENPVKYFIRKIYYKLLHRIADINHIEQFMGFGLYDRTFIDILKSLDDPLPYLRGMVAELCENRIAIEYTQDVRKKGKTHFAFWNLFDYAMIGITSYSKKLLRLSTIIGTLTGFVSTIMAIIIISLKVFGIVDYPIGMATVGIGVFMLGAANLFFLGLLGEYIFAINTRVIHRPLVIEEERLNF